MSCNFVINQQSSLPVSDNVATEAKVKDPKGKAGVKTTRNVHEKTKGKMIRRHR